MRIWACNRGSARHGGVLIAILLVCGSITFVDAAGQSGSQARTGIVALRDWPEQRGEQAQPIDYSEFRLLPFIDTLTVGYRFDRSRGRPVMEFALEWALGDEGVVDGRRVGVERLPRSVVIESIDLTADVVVGDESVARFYLPLDTLRLSPGPSVALVEVRDVGWENVFVDVDSATARQIYSEDFRLTDLRILRVVFTTDPRDTAYAYPERPDDEWTTVVVPDVDVWVAWGGRTRWRPPVTLLSPSDRDRREEIGRDKLVDRDRGDRGYDREDDQQQEAGEERTEEQESDRTSDRRARRKGDRSSGGGLPLPKKKSNDDDDDDEDRLLPGALAGVAAIGGLAVLGGTVGYMGSIDKAPIGLMAGRVGRRGGALFHVAVNRQVFGKAPGSENLSVGVTGFVDVFRFPIQPALGIGMRITEEGAESTRTLPSLAVGLAANLDHLVLLAAFDVESKDVRVGLALNFRAILADQ